MVVTRLWEFTTKGKEAWSSGTSSTSTSPARPITVPRGDSATQPDEDGSYWNFAVNSMQNAATSVSGKVTSLFGADPPSTQQTEDERTSFYSSYNPFALWSQGTAAAPIITSRLNVIDEFDEDDDHDAGFGASNPTPFHDISRRSMKANSWSNTPHADLLWMFRHDKNPYSAVRGRDTQPSSMTADRSLVALIPPTWQTSITLRQHHVLLDFFFRVPCGSCVCIHTYRHSVSYSKQRSKAKSCIRNGRDRRKDDRMFQTEFADRTTATVLGRCRGRPF